MRLRKSLMEFHKIAYHDEILVRYLEYKAESTVDDVTVETELRPNIVGSAIHSEIVKRSIHKSAISPDIDDKEICRIVISAGKLRSSSIAAGSQAVRIYIFTHYTFEEDFRSLLIIDRLYKLFKGRKIGDFGNVDVVDANQVTAPKGYSGYMIEFDFGAVKGGR